MNILAFWSYFVKVIKPASEERGNLHKTDPLKGRDYMQTHKLDGGVRQDSV